MELHPLQEDAVNEIKRMRHRHVEEVVIAGPAGTGKSSVITEAMKGSYGYKVAAPTHKACDVLRRRGVTGVCTIHSLMYNMVDETKEEPILDKDGKQLIDEETKEPLFETVVIGQKWVARDEPITEPVCFEEGSMIGGRMLGDIRRLTQYRAIVGDPFQLPPVKDADVFSTTTPDVTLEHVWRIDDSPPLAMATAIRNKEPSYPHLFDIPVMPRTQGTWDHAAAQDDAIIIVWKNITRHYINQQIREMLGRTNWVPVEGDKIIFYDTDKDIGVYNGLSGVVDAVVSVDKYHCNLRIQTGDSEFRTLTCLSGPFRGEPVKRYGRRQEDDPVHVEYAYAITCHKAQGSEWKTVYVVDDVKGMSPIMGINEARRWLYTAVTRTTENLIIVR